MKFLANNAKKIATAVVVLCVGRIIYVAISASNR